MERRVQAHSDINFRHGIVADASLDFVGCSTMFYKEPAYGLRERHRFTEFVTRSVTTQGTTGFDVIEICEYSLRCGAIHDLEQLVVEAELDREIIVFVTEISGRYNHDIQSLLRASRFGGAVNPFSTGWDLTFYSPEVVAWMMPLDDAIALDFIAPGVFNDEHRNLFHQRRLVVSIDDMAHAGLATSLGQTNTYFQVRSS